MARCLQQIGMLKILLQTDNDPVYLFLRIVAGIIIFPYGMQKLFGWFDDLGGGVGIKGSMEKLREKKIQNVQFFKKLGT